jgi:hypothetical protein
MDGANPRNSSAPAEANDPINSIAMSTTLRMTRAPGRQPQ